MVVGRLRFKGETCFALPNYDCEDNAPIFFCLRLAEMSRDNCGSPFPAVSVEAPLHIVPGIPCIVSNEFIEVSTREFILKCVKSMLILTFPDG
jgi:hypothetical protein